MMKKTSFTNVYPLTVRWGDADALGHINNVEFIRYFESGRVNYVENTSDVPFSPEMKEGWILADIQCSYIQQVHYPQELEICSCMSKLGNKSATVTAHIYRKGEKVPVATSKGVVVWFDFVAQKTKRIPDGMRQAIIKYEQHLDLSSDES